ncbi:hypothetical protein PR202_gb13490 [Eleusine coracana subsp. coracana]|uniref:Uncharacterized protein n=1 Tax=Eleusine coracana subsp. coracana TaxID=191504 RepID=A0AAV5ES65_ELECO|nr:hypothetical protein QOZ80_9BG0715730 [Eleusine coracana subsp. coracana]GJN25637.1 hypothetical protein PR202_gb13490 [Eleusine coracana subsp. coracana]
MAAGSCGNKRVWMEEVEKTLHEAEAWMELTQWERRCIYRVPASIKDRNPQAYRPRVVSLGPFHHGDEQLLPMEEHKRRALRHLLRRAKKPLADFAAAVEEVMEQLQSAYLDLDKKWLDVDGREKFLEMMIMDGCFQLEVMRATAISELNRGQVNDYAPNDSIFSRHGVLYRVPYIRGDMLMIENQLPLLLLKNLLAVEQSETPADHVVNRLVLKFLSPSSRMPPTAISLGLHPLDVYRRSMLYGVYQRPLAFPDAPETDMIRSAAELYEAGIRLKKSSTESLHDIRFRHGVLKLPAVRVDDSTTELVLLNLIAFELLHVGAGNDVTAYAFFMNSIVRSARDVALLSSQGIILNLVGSDEAVVDLFHSISKDAVLEPDGVITSVQRQVNAHCQKPWNTWRANIIRNYFRSPTSFINFVAATIVLLMTIVQTVYAIVSFHSTGQDKNS